MAVGAVITKEKDTIMDDRSYSSRTNSDADRFGRWLKTRPAESWMFFAVGLVLGSFFL